MNVSGIRSPQALKPTGTPLGKAGSSVSGQGAAGPLSDEARGRTNQPDPSEPESNGPQDRVSLSDEVAGASQPKPSKDLSESQTVGGVKGASKSHHERPAGHQALSPSSGHDQKEREAKKNDDQSISKKVTKFSPGSASRGPRTSNLRPSKTVTPPADIVSGKQPGQLGGPPMRTVKEAKGPTHTVMGERRPTNRISRSQYLNNLQSTWGE